MSAGSKSFYKFINSCLTIPSGQEFWNEGYWLPPWWPRIVSRVELLQPMNTSLWSRPVDSWGCPKLLLCFSFIFVNTRMCGKHPHPLICATSAPLACWPRMLTRGLLSSTIATRKHPNPWSTQRGLAHLSLQGKSLGNTCGKPLTKHVFKKVKDGICLPSWKLLVCLKG